MQCDFHREIRWDINIFTGDRVSKAGKNRAPTLHGRYIVNLCMQILNNLRLNSRRWSEFFFFFFFLRDKFITNLLLRVNLISKGERETLLRDAFEKVNRLFVASFQKLNCLDKSWKRLKLFKRRDCFVALRSNN